MQNDEYRMQNSESRMMNAESKIRWQRPELRIIDWWIYRWSHPSLSFRILRLILLYFPLAAIWIQCHSALAASIHPPPRTTSSSYSTTACPGVMAVCGSSKRTVSASSPVTVTVAGCGWLL